MRALLLVVVFGCGNGTDWDRKDAHRQCSAAIATYPARQAPPCPAMAMCLNEAALDVTEQKRLLEMMAKAGCPPP
jgi:hypothetical protein